MNVYLSDMKNKILKLPSSRLSMLLLLIMLFPMMGNAQTIAELQQEAAENNPELRASYQRYLSALEEPQIVGSLSDPEISFSYFIKPIETRVGPQQGRISVSQMLPWFGTLNTKRTASELAAKAAFEVFQENRNRLFYEVESAALDLYETDRSIRLAEENLQILTSLTELSLSRYETNRASQVDVLRAQIEEEDLRVRIELLKDNREVLNRKLAELLNRDGNRRIESAESTSPAGIATLEELLMQIRQQNPELSRLRYREATSAEARSLARKKAGPDIMLGVDYIFTGESDMPGVANSGEDALMVMAGFRLPIFGKKNSSRVRQAEENVREAELQTRSVENDLETSLESSIRDHDDAKRRFELYDSKQIQRINQAIDIMMEAYASDRSEFEEILRMQRKLLSYQFLRLEAETDRQKAEAYIEYLTGRHNIKNEME